MEVVALACTPPEEAGRAWVRWSVQARGRVQRGDLAPLDLVMRAFSRRYLRNRVSQSWAELIAHIYRALDEYNRLYARPFKWYARRISAKVH